MTEKKATTRKKATKAKVEDQVVEQEHIEEQAEVKEAPKPRKLEKDDPIPVMNNTTGTFFHRSPNTGFTFELEQYGNVIDIPFEEVRNMRTSARRAIDEAFVIILDENAIKELRLEKLYENILDAEGVDDILGDFDRLEEMIDKMPSMMKVAIGAIAKRKFDNNELYDLRIAKLIKEKLGVNINRDF